MSAERGEPRDQAIEGAARELLESLEALAVVYESAKHLADVVGEVSIADYTLGRCIEAVNGVGGAVYVNQDGAVELAAEAGAGAAMFTPAALEEPGAGAFFRNGDAARPLFAGEVLDRGVLLAPIDAGSRRLGTALVYGAEGQHFTTKDVKIVAAVTSQAAIALSSAQHYRNVVLERSKLRHVIEDIREGVVVLTPEGRIVLCNSVARELFEIPGEQVEGTDFLARLAEWDFLGDMRSFDHEREALEISRGTGNAATVLAVRSAAIQNSKHEVANIVLTIHDISENRREERLKRDFLSLMSHKFRTPLTGIVGALTMLGDDEIVDRTDLLDEANTRIAELTGLVDRLLYFAELMEGSWSTAGHADLIAVRGALHDRLLQRYASHEPDLQWDLAEDARWVGLPPSRVTVLLENLVDNSLKFSLPDRPQVRITSRPGANGAVLLVVEDRGPGIPAADRLGIFEPFHQREVDFTGNVSGAGIGLGIVGEIVRRVGGRAEVAPAKPKGTIVSLELPGAVTPTGAEP